MAKGKRFTRDDLTDKQLAFVDEYIARGGTRPGATEAAMVAYGYERETASQQASRLLKHEKVRDVIVEETLASFAALGAMAADKLVEILETGMWFGQAVKPSDGLKAIQQALERGIGPIAHIHEHNVNHELDGKTGKELRAAVVAELRKLPDRDRATMLQAIGISPDAKVIDVDAVEVDPDAPWGRKNDGTPKEKPGAKKQLFGKPAPPAKPSDNLAQRIAAIKAKKLAAKRAEASNE